jgi:hypothetical protein
MYVKIFCVSCGTTIFLWIRVPFYYLYKIPREDEDALNLRVDQFPSSGCAVAQAVSLWLPTAAARVRVRAACGVCGGQNSTGAGFLLVLWFPLPIIPQISLSS